MDDTLMQFRRCDLCATHHYHNCDPTKDTYMVTPSNQLPLSEPNFLLHIRPNLWLQDRPPLEAWLKSAKHNLPCARDHPEIVDQYLVEELSQNRIGSQYHINWATMHVSHFGVIPKHHQPNKWRLVVDLCHPAKQSVNDGIPKSLCSLSLITIDLASLTSAKDPF